MHGLLGEYCVITAGPPDEQWLLRIGVKKQSVLCEIVSGVILANYTGRISSAVLVEVTNIKTIFTYFYYKYLKLRILILMFAHLRVTHCNDCRFQFKVNGSVSYPQQYCNTYFMIIVSEL